MGAFVLPGLSSSIFMMRSRSITYSKLPGFLLLATLIGGCGYQAGTLTPHGIHSVAIPVAENVTFYRKIELPLTRQIVQELLARTSLDIVEERYADSNLKIRIIDVRQPVLTKNEHDQITEVRVLVTVEVTWTDLRTGEVIMKRDRITESNEFSAVQGENIDLATERALQQMAERIVTEMESSQW